jgi:ribosomal protein S18 acetylase RimI-like enzyme
MSTTSGTATIRRATSDDAAALAELGAATFVETFGHLYPPEDLQAFLAKNHTPESWFRTLTDPDRGTWVAEQQNGRKIGFIGVGACKLPVQDLESTAGEIQQLYVLAEFHNLRLGTRFMDTGLEWLASQGRSPLYVGVWSENYGAQRFYARYGFNKVGEYGFPVGNTVDREFILKR